MLFLIKKITTIDVRSTERQTYVQLYLSDILEYGEHTIKASGKSVFELYKFVFWPSMKAKRINSTEMLSAFEWHTEPDQIGGIRE